MLRLIPAIIMLSISGALFLEGFRVGGTIVAIVGLAFLCWAIYSIGEVLGWDQYPGEEGRVSESIPSKPKVRRLRTLRVDF
jgi:protein-S-isoprenylcysteine O-methyltransferase Ste14